MPRYLELTAKKAISPWYSVWVSWRSCWSISSTPEKNLVTIRPSLDRNSDATERSIRSLRRNGHLFSLRSLTMIIPTGTSSTSATWVKV